MPSRAKLRKLAAAKKSDTERVADITYRELYSALTQLGALVKKHHEEIAMLADNLSEVSLRLRYVMQHFKFHKSAGMLDANGQPLVGEVATLFDRYNAERDRFLASLTKDLDHDVAPADSHDRAEGRDAGRAPGTHERGHNGDAIVEPPVAPGPRLVPAAPVAPVAS